MLYELRIVEWSSAYPQRKVARSKKEPQTAVWLWVRMSSTYFDLAIAFSCPATTAPLRSYSTYDSVCANSSSFGGASMCSAPPYFSRILFDFDAANFSFFSRKILFLSLIHI